MGDLTDLTESFRCLTNFVVVPIRILLAAKFHDDLYYNNAFYSKLGKQIG